MANWVPMRTLQKELEEAINTVSPHDNNIAI